MGVHWAKGEVVGEGRRGREGECDEGDEHGGRPRPVWLGAKLRERLKTVVTLRLSRLRVQQVIHLCLPQPQCTPQRLNVDM
jgi:hypothetical protein